MIDCPVCCVSYVANTLFCTECGLYLLETEEIGTDPLESVGISWQGEVSGFKFGERYLPDTGPLTIRLRVSSSGPAEVVVNRARELEVALVKPIRLGRIDPMQEIYPDVDLTDDKAIEYGVSRMHACIFRRGNVVAVEDLASTNGTLLNGKRLSPYLPEYIRDGDQIQLGRLLIDVYFKVASVPPEPAGNQAASSLFA